MWNRVLFKKTSKLNYKLLLIFSFILLFYFIVMVSMYDEEGSNALMEMLKTFPPEFIAALNMATFPDSSLVGFLSSFFYGLIAVAFPMIFNIICANKLVAKLVDRGSMAYLLSTPNTRVKVIVTQMTFLIAANIILFSSLTIAGLFFSSLLFPNSLDFGKFVLLNFGAFLLQLTISSIAFFGSTVFNDQKCLYIGAGVPILFLLIQMISSSSDKLDFLKYFTIFTFFNPYEIVKNNLFILPFLSMFVLAVVIFGSSIYIFNKKDLSL